MGLTSGTSDLGLAGTGSLEHELKGPLFLAAHPCLSVSVEFKYWRGTGRMLSRHQQTLVLRAGNSRQPIVLPGLSAATTAHLLLASSAHSDPSGKGECRLAEVSCDTSDRWDHNPADSRTHRRIDQHSVGQSRRQLCPDRNQSDAALHSRHHID